MQTAVVAQPVTDLSVMASRGEEFFPARVPGCDRDLVLMPQEASNPIWLKHANIVKLK